MAVIGSVIYHTVDNVLWNYFYKHGNCFKPVKDANEHVINENN